MHSAACEADKASSSISTQTSRRFSLAEITSATNNFDDDQVIGRGGFGKVYKGIIYDEHISHDVAIKRLDSMSNQGASEFKAEIDMLSKVRHCHLVSLIGFCDENKEMILVYEYMPHGTLYQNLHKAVTHINWVQRLKIAIGAARGLDYLHTGFGTQQGIIHRDVKSSNILLDKKWAAKISDFGLSKVGPTNQSISYVDASVKGTFGYLDPEYFYTRKLTRKTDVYAFGVVLFELLSGRLPVDERYGEDQCSLVRWVQKCVKDRKLDQMVDSSIRGTIFPLCLRRFAYIANQCLLNIPKERPTMTEVVASLHAILELHEKYKDSASSLGTTWLTSKMSKYFAFLSTVNSDHVGTSKSTGGITNAHQETPSQCMEMDLVSENVSTTPDRFSYSKLPMREIARATQNFSPSLRLGEGGFGTVYKAQLSDGQVVAIKRAKKGASEFRAEIEMLSKVRHCHLVSLISFCDENKEMVLVYEYMPHGTLYHHLHKAVTHINWVQRLKIAIGAARGLDYLHTGFSTQQGIIHRDVKSSNILLDKKWVAKISDFGLYKDGPTNQSISYVSVKWTFGYLDPQYFYTRKLTRETDVYAFGVVLFELLSGRLPVDERYGEEQCSLVRWAQKCVKERKLDQMVDSSIRGTIFPLCLRRFAYIANQCLLNIPKERPTMTEVVASLQAIIELQEKYKDSASSLGTTWLTSKMSKYFSFLSTVNSDHVGTSKSTGGDTTAHQETISQCMEMNLVSENFLTTPD